MDAGINPPKPSEKPATTTIRVALNVGGKLQRVVLITRICHPPFPLFTGEAQHSKPSFRVDLQLRVVVRIVMQPVGQLRIHVRQRFPRRVDTQACPIIGSHMQRNQKLALVSPEPLQHLDTAADAKRTQCICHGGSVCGRSGTCTSLNSFKGLGDVKPALPVVEQSTQPLGKLFGLWDASLTPHGLVDGLHVVRSALGLGLGLGLGLVGGAQPNLCRI